MIALETLQAKRGALVAQRRDITAQIGMLDSLIAEAEAMERAATAAANRACGIYISPNAPSPLVGAVLDDLVAENAAPETPPVPPHFERVPWVDAKDILLRHSQIEREFSYNWVPPDAAPEMLPVVHEDAQHVCCGNIPFCVDCPL